MPPPNPTPRAGPRRPALRAALVAVGLVSALLTAVAAYLGVDFYPAHAWVIAAYPVLGLAFVVVGTVAWSRRPSNRTGALLCATGGWVLAAALGSVEEPHLQAFGVLVGQLPIAAALHLMLAFPSGRVGNAIDRGLVVGGYLVTLLLQVPDAFPAVAAPSALDDVLSYVAIAIVVAAAARVAFRVRGSGRGTSERHVLIGVYGYGSALLLFFPFSARVLTPWLGLDVFGLFALQIAVFAAAPFVFALGLLRGGFARTGEVAEFIAWLGSQDPRRTSLRDALALVLGDPSLEVLFTRTGTGEFISPDGRPATATTARDRGLVPVPGPDGGAPSATLVYDRILIGDPTTVEQAGRLASLALERERLHAELLAEREALRASRLRVVEIGDVQRRQLAQDLHDVVQSRLALAALRAGRLTAAATDERTREQAAQMRDELDDLITEFRHVVHGVMPALLLERGLPAAVEDLLDRCPVPAQLTLHDATDLPGSLATTAYFIVAEAVANAVRHGEPGRIEVVVAQRTDTLELRIADDGRGGARPTGAGLRGIADRVDALGGRLDIASAPGRGTTLTVELPCAS